MLSSTRAPSWPSVGTSAAPAPELESQGAGHLCRRLVSAPRPRYLRSLFSHSYDHPQAGTERAPKTGGRNTTLVGKVVAAQLGPLALTRWPAMGALGALGRWREMPPRATCPDT